MNTQIKSLAFAVFLILELTVSQKCYAQYDRKWSVGQFNSIVDFNTSGLGTVVTDSKKFLPCTIAGSSIYDSVSGKVWFSNGLDIVSDSYDTVPGAYPLTDSLYAETYSGGSLGRQSVLMLPKGKNEFYTIVASGSDTGSGFLDRTYYSVISRNAPGFFKLVRKRVPILSEIVSPQMTSALHANGHDWWIVQKAVLGNKYYVFLATADTIILDHTQIIGDSTATKFSDASSCAKFSPQGNKYVFTSVSRPPTIFDFDRCSGEFSNPQIINAPWILPNGDTPHHIITGKPAYLATGVAFSPSGRYVYWNNYYNVTQFDLSAPNPNETGILVGKYDSAAYLGETVPLGYGYLTPKGEIWYDSHGIMDAYPVIRFPDSSGLSCHFVPRGVIVPAYTISPLPNVVSFNYEVSIGKKCDDVNGIIDRYLLNPIIYPNPANGQFRISAEEGTHLSYVISTAEGAEALRGETLSGGEVQADLPPGFYVVRVSDGTKQVSVKLVISR